MCFRVTLSINLVNLNLCEFLAHGAAMAGKLRQQDLC